MKTLPYLIVMSSEDFYLHITAENLTLSCYWLRLGLREECLIHKLTACLHGYNFVLNVTINYKHIIQFNLQYMLKYGMGC
jgi:hypothetical protein